MAGKNEAKVRFNAETSEFTQAINDAKSSMSTLRAEMQLNEAQFQNTGNETEYLQQKAQLLESQLEANADKQEALTQKLEAAKKTYGEDSEEVAKLERQLIYAQTEEEKLKTQLDNTNQALDGQTTAAEEAGSSVENMADILVGAGIASAIKDIADAAIDMAGSFSEASAAIVEGTGATGEALEDLNQQAMDAFGSIADADQSLSGVSEILAELNTRFGVAGDAAEDLTVKVANFAQHTGTDGVKAVDDIANVMKRWNIPIEEADSLLDDLTTANQSCQMSVDELTRYLSDNSVQFQELGYNTGDALAMLISLSDGGANVSAVMSGMKKAVSTLSETTDDVPGAFQDAIKAIGECDTVSEALQAQVGDTGKTVEEVFGKRAAQELAANVQNGNFNIEEWTRVLEENQGALEDTTEGATTMQDAWSQATNNVSLALGGTLAPAISDVVIAVSDVITQASQVVQETPALQAVVVGLAAALGVLAAALAIGGVITAVTAAFGVLTGVIGLAAAPIIAVIAVIAALVAALVYAYNHCETFRNIVNTVFTAIKTFIVTAVTTIKNTIVTQFNQIKNTFTTIWNAAKTIVTTVWGGIKSTVSSAVNTVRTTVTNVFNTVKSTVTTVWNAIKTAITNPVQTAKTTVTTVFNALKSTVSNVVNGLKTTVTSAFNAIKDGMTKPMEKAKSTLTGIVNKIKGIFPVRLGKILHFSLPSIHVSGGSAPWGIGGKGSKPSFSVSWSSHAAGGVFNRPTLIPTMRAIHEVGEAGPEAISPVSVLQEYIGAAVQKYMPLPIDYDLLGRKVADACAGMNITMEVDDRELGRVVRGLV